MKGKIKKLTDKIYGGGNSHCERHIEPLQGFHIAYAQGRVHHRESVYDIEPKISEYMDKIQKD